MAPRKSKKVTVTLPSAVLDVVQELGKGKRQGSVDQVALKKLKALKLRVKDATYPQGIICRFDLSCWIIK